MRYILFVPTEVVDAIEESGLSLPQFVRKSIKWILTIQAIRKNGGRIFVQLKPGDKLTEIID